MRRWGAGFPAAGRQAPDAGRVEQASGRERMPVTEKWGGALPLALVVAALATLAPFTIDTYLPSFPDIGSDLDANTRPVSRSILRTCNRPNWPVLS